MIEVELVIEVEVDRAVPDDRGPAGDRAAARCLVIEVEVELRSRSSCAMR